MTFHQSQEFADALYGCRSFKMRPIFIEKDYWVTYVLKKLITIETCKQKSFLKCTFFQKHIIVLSSFSEDIDLALVKESETSANQLNKKWNQLR